MFQQAKLSKISAPMGHGRLQLALVKYATVIKTQLATYTT